MKIWAFRDLASGTVRVTTTDPSGNAVFAAMQKTTVGVPGGVSLRDLLRNLDSALQALNGTSGSEMYIELDLGGITSEILDALMTPPS